VASKPTVGRLVWYVDPRSGQIFRDGEIVRVDARTTKLLMCLAERAGEVVSIDDRGSDIGWWRRLIRGWMILAWSPSLFPQTPLGRHAVGVVGTLCCLPQAPPFLSRS